MGVYALVLMLVSSVLMALAAQSLCAQEMRRMVKKEGGRYDGAVIEWLDMTIITLSSLLFQISLFHGTVPVMLIGGAFGAFLAAACWSDAQTGWVPDSVIIPSLVLGVFYAWCLRSGGLPDPITALLIALGCLAFFGMLLLAFMLLPFVRITPPDAVFSILIVLTPKDIPQMLIVLITLMACLLLVRTRPQWVRALIPAEERARLTSQMEEAMDYETGHMEGKWYPLGPLALVCVLVGVCANALL